MARVLRCRDAGVDRHFEARADTFEEVVRQCAVRGKEAHGTAEIPPGLEDLVGAAILDERPAPLRSTPPTPPMRARP